LSIAPPPDNRAIFSENRVKKWRTTVATLKYASDVVTPRQDVRENYFIENFSNLHLEVNRSFKQISRMVQLELKTLAFFI
jgi:hypothetical protein